MILQARHLLTLALLCVSVVALLWGYAERMKAQAHLTRLEAVQRDLEAAEATLETLQASARQDAAQAAQRDTLSKPVKQAAKAVKQSGGTNPHEVRPAASDAQLERLRALADAANGSIAAASELP